MTTSRYSHLYPGNPETDPAPVYRDLSPHGVQGADGAILPWPNGAVFAVVLTPDDIARAGGSAERARCEFFGLDGWPLDFPTPSDRLSMRLLAQLRPVFDHIVRIPHIDDVVSTRTAHESRSR